MRSWSSNTCSSAPSALASASASPDAGVHDARRDPQPIAGSLKAADDGKVEMQVARSAARSAPTRRTASTTRTRSMMRCVPAARRSLVTVSAMPDDSHANSRSVLTLVKSSTAMAGGAARRPAGRRLRRRSAGGIVLDRCDESIAAARNGLNVGRLGGSSPSACRSSETACVSALSVTATSGHSAANSSSFGTSAD